MDIQTLKTVINTNWKLIISFYHNGQIKKCSAPRGDSTATGDVRTEDTLYNYGVK